MHDAGPGNTEIVTAWREWVCRPSLRRSMSEDFKEFFRGLHYTLITARNRRWIRRSSISFKADQNYFRGVIVVALPSQSVTGGLLQLCQGRCLEASTAAVIARACCQQRPLVMRCGAFGDNWCC